MKWQRTFCLFVLFCVAWVYCRLVGKQHFVGLPKNNLYVPGKPDWIWQLECNASWIKATAGQMQLEGSESHVANCHFVMFTNMLSSNPPGATSPYYYFFCLLPDITVTFECIWMSLVLLKLAPLPAKHVADFLHHGVEVKIKNDLSFLQM